MRMAFISAWLMRGPGGSRVCTLRRGRERRNCHRIRWQQMQRIEYSIQRRILGTLNEIALDGKLNKILALEVLVGRVTFTYLQSLCESAYPSYNMHYIMHVT